MMGVNDVGIFFRRFLFKICMAYFGPFQCMICGIYDLINVKIVLNKAADANPVKNLIFASVLMFFHINLPSRWTKILIGGFEALILSF